MKFFSFPTSKRNDTKVPARRANYDHLLRQRITGTDLVGHNPYAFPFYYKVFPSSPSTETEQNSAFPSRGTRDRTMGVKQEDTGFRLDVAPTSPVLQKILDGNRITWALDEETNTKRVVYADFPRNQATPDVKAFIKAMAYKSIQLQTIGTERGGMARTFTSQAGLVREKDGTVRLYTALHAVTANPGLHTNHITAKFWGQGGLEKAFAPRFSQQGRRPSTCFEVLFEQPNIGWFGYDVTSCPIDIHDERNDFDERMVFDQVPPEYKLEPGMKVGMFYNAMGMGRTADTTNIHHGRHDQQYDNRQLVRICGPGYGVNLLTGELMEVHEYHVISNTNGFAGCSGAKLFLLEGPHRGKVIGVNVGNTSVGSNKLNDGALAFRLKPTRGARMNQLQWLGTRIWRTMIRAPFSSVKKIQDAEQSAGVADGAEENAEVVDAGENAEVVEVADV